MKMYDCGICLSAGSVNQWGVCEICGKDFGDGESRFARGEAKPGSAIIKRGQLRDVLSAINKDAA